MRSSFFPRPGGNLNLLEARLLVEGLVRGTVPLEVKGSSFIDKTCAWLYITMPVKLAYLSWRDLCVCLEGSY